MIEQTKFTYFPLEKPLEKQTKIIEDQIRKQIEASKFLKPAKHQQEQKSMEASFPKELENNEVKNELNDFKKLEEKVDRKDLEYETNKYKHDF